MITAGAQQARKAGGWRSCLLPIRLLPFPSDSAAVGNTRALCGPQRERGVGEDEREGGRERGREGEREREERERERREQCSERATTERERPLPRR